MDIPDARDRIIPTFPGTCRCEFQAETYMCFEEDQFNTWRPIYHRYSRSNALASLGQWWSVNYTNV